jgi:hypothetical protein
MMADALRADVWAAVPAGREAPDRAEPLAVGGPLERRSGAPAANPNWRPSVNTRTIALIALIIAVIVLVILLS